MACKLPEPTQFHKAIDIYLAHAYPTAPPLTVRSMMNLLKTWAGEFYASPAFARTGDPACPRLTVRLVDGPSPIRVIVDSRLRIPLEANVLSDDAATTIIATTHAAPEAKAVAIRSRGAVVMRARTASDGTVGTPYLLARGSGLRSVPLSLDPTSQSAAVGASATLTAQLLDGTTGAPVAGCPGLAPPPLYFLYLLFLKIMRIGPR